MNTSDDKHYPFQEWWDSAPKADRPTYEVASMAWNAGVNFARSSTGTTVDAITLTDIVEQIDHIEKNGISLAKFGGQNVDEGRCRELCAMYLREWIHSEELRRKLVALSAVSATGTPLNPGRVEVAVRHACRFHQIADDTATLLWPQVWECLAKCDPVVAAQVKWQAHDGENTLSECESSPEQAGALITAMCKKFNIRMKGMEMFIATSDGGTKDA